MMQTIMTFTCDTCCSREDIRAHSICYCGHAICYRCRRFTPEGLISCKNCAETQPMYTSHSFQPHNSRFSVKKQPKIGGLVSRPSRPSERVIVPNVVYLMSLPDALGSDDTLRNSRFLGQYGKIEKIIIHKNGTAHVTFASAISAKLCIRSLDGFVYMGNKISALVGTTKYPEDVDMQKIVTNSLMEPALVPCVNPIFPSPILHPQSLSVLTTTQVPFSPPQSCMDSSSSLVEHQAVFTEDRPTKPVFNSSSECFVFGTGGLVSSMWTDNNISSSSSSSSSNKNITTSNHSHNNHHRAPFVPVESEDEDNIDSSSCNGYFETTTTTMTTFSDSRNNKEDNDIANDISSHFIPALDIFGLCDNYSPPGDPGCGCGCSSSSEDNWSNSSDNDFDNDNSYNGEDLNLTPRGIVDLDFDMDIDMAAILEEVNEKEELMQFQLQLPCFSPCKDMVRAVHAHAFQPSANTNTNNNNHVNVNINNFKDLRDMSMMTMMTASNMMVSHAQFPQYFQPMSYLQQQQQQYRYQQQYQQQLYYAPNFCPTTTTYMQQQQQQTYY